MKKLFYKLDPILEDLKEIILDVNNSLYNYIIKPNLNLLNSSDLEENIKRLNFEEVFYILEENIYNLDKEITEEQNNKFNEEPYLSIFKLYGFKEKKSYMFKKMLQFTFNVMKTDLFEKNKGIRIFLIKRRSCRIKFFSIIEENIINDYTLYKYFLLSLLYQYNDILKNKNNLKDFFIEIKERFDLGDDFNVFPYGKYYSTIERSNGKSRFIKTIDILTENNILINSIKYNFINFLSIVKNNNIVLYEEIVIKNFFITYFNLYSFMSTNYYKIVDEKYVIKKRGKRIIKEENNKFIIFGKEYDTNINIIFGIFKELFFEIMDPILELDFISYVFNIYKEVGHNNKRLIPIINKMFGSNTVEFFDEVENFEDLEIGYEISYKKLYDLFYINTNIDTIYAFLRELFQENNIIFEYLFNDFFELEIEYIKNRIKAKINGYDSINIEQGYYIYYYLISLNEFEKQFFKYNIEESVMEKRKLIFPTIECKKCGRSVQKQTDFDILIGRYQISAIEAGFILGIDRQCCINALSSPYTLPTTNLYIEPEYKEKILSDSDFLKDFQRKIDETRKIETGNVPLKKKEKITNYETKIDRYIFEKSEGLIGKLIHDKDKIFEMIELVYVGEDENKTQQKIENNTTVRIVRRYDLENNQPYI